MGNAGRFFFAILITGICLLPLIGMSTGALRDTSLPPARTFSLLPERPKWENFSDSYNLVNIPQYTLNSFIVAGIVTSLTIVFSSYTAFILTISSRTRRHAGLVTACVAMMIPPMALHVSRFVLFSMMGMTGTLVPIIVSEVMTMLPLCVLMYYVGFSTIPASLFDVCRLEGMLPFRIWRCIALPLLRPVSIGIGTLVFIFSWGDFVHPLLYLSEESSYTAPLGLQSLTTLDPADYPLFLAGAVTVTVPVLVLFLFSSFYLHRRQQISK